jgi:hypothetical protein
LAKFWRQKIAPKAKQIAPKAQKIGPKAQKYLRTGELFASLVTLPSADSDSEGCSSGQIFFVFRPAFGHAAINQATLCQNDKSLYDCALRRQLPVRRRR